MFTGLVEDLGRLAKLERRADALLLFIEGERLPLSEIELGDSLAVDGVCLTVTAREENRLQVLAGAETLSRTTLSERRTGDRVHLERALRVGDRLGGHLVSGHIDGIARVSGRRDRGANLELDFELPAELLRYVVAKGSITIDGVSLTVNAVRDRAVGVALIPHTQKNTALATKAVGAGANIEVDMIGKYVERLLEGYCR